MKIYTKAGDGGTTGTLRGRMDKSDQLAVALGAIDEVNSWVGLCRRNLKFEILNLKIDDEYKRIQTNLLIIGSGLAGSGLKIKSDEVKHLENLIDKLTVELPRLTNFIYPVGELQVARSVCRRAEREIVALGITEKNILKYMNRLSDALFTMARWVNWKLKMPEEVWRG